MAKQAQVQRQQKELPYSVSVIGDEQALNFWREHRKAKERLIKLEQEMRYAGRRDKAISYVTNQEVNPFTYTKEEREELEIRKARLKAAKAELEAMKEPQLQDIVEDSAPSFWQKIKNFFA